jgi:hypothetical protein
VDFTLPDVSDSDTRVQLVDTDAVTAAHASVEKSMAKTREIPPDKNRERTFKHAAPVEEVEAVKARVESIGWGWHDAVADAGVSRNVGYTLLRGEGSVGSLRTIEAWLKRQEESKKASLSKEPREAWAALGEELEKLGVDQLGATIEAVREYISAEKRRRAAFSKLLRVNPDPHR